MRWLCAGIAVVAVLEFLIATIGVQLGNLPPSTDFASYYLAGAEARDQASPYDRGAIAARGHALGFAHDQFPFLYPPSFALAMQPLAALPYPRARQIWMVLATLALLAGLATTVALVRAQARLLALHDSNAPWLVLAAFVPMALNSTSIHNDIRAGSVGCMLFATLAFVAFAFVRGPAHRGGIGSGIAITIATLCKLTPAALIPYCVWRGARRAGWTAGVLLVLVTIPALVHWGPGIVTDYWRMALAPSLHDEVAPPMNQSLDAFLSRLLVRSNVIAAPFDAPGWKRVLSIGLGLAICGLVLRRVLARRRTQALLPVELGLVVIAILVLMKLTWVHTLSAMLWVWPAVMLPLQRIAAATDAAGSWARRTMLLASAGFFLAAAHVPILWPPLRQGMAVVITGVHLFGLLLLGFACWRVLGRPELERFEAT
jgi:hypothetical protein